MKAHLCGNIMCKSKHIAIYIPVVRFWMKGAPKDVPAGHAIIRELRLCDNCASTARVHDVVTNKRWAEICSNIASRRATLPDRETIELKFTIDKETPA